MSAAHPRDRAFFSPLLNRIADVAGERAALILGREKACQTVYFPKEPALVGKTLAQISASRGTDPAQTLMDLIKEDGAAEEGAIIATSMDATPFGECQQGNDPMQQMVGVKLGPGWRQAIERALGGVRGCTHLRELLFNMATAAYQTVFPYRDSQRRSAGEKPSQAAQPPYHLGRCIAWDFNGPVVMRYYPQFAGLEKKKA